jgi:hypothetical protein
MSNDKRNRGIGSGSHMTAKMIANDPTEEQIWGPIDPATGLHTGGGLAELNRDPMSRFGQKTSEAVERKHVMMLPYGREKLLGNN